MARMRFHQFAWGLLAYNLAVILGGAFVRATISGDGCGNHWPDCNGQLIPHNPGRLATLIEFSHRLSSGLLLLLAPVLVVWAFRAFPRRDPVRAASAAVLGLTLAEALIGAGLVLFRLVAHDRSVHRAVVMPTHLVMTFFLLMALALTAWWSSGGARPSLRGRGSLAAILGVGLLSTILLGISGAIAALGDTLFPSGSILEGLRQDFSPTAHFLIGLRVYHPVLAIAAGLYLAVIVAVCPRLRPTVPVQRLSQTTGILFACQMGAGLLNFTLLAPVWMQLVHLLLADLFWISLVLLSAAALSEQTESAAEALRPASPSPAVLPHPAPRAGQTATAEAVAAVAEGSGPPPSTPSPAEPREGDSDPDSAGPVTGWRLATQYLALTKPRVCSLLLFTTLAAMWIAAGGHGTPPGPGLCLAVALGFYMAAGAANAINMVLERDLDLRMGRTSRRPIVTQAIPPAAALRFAGILLLGSFGTLWSAANLLSALLALGGLVFYVVVYTILLKRRTWLNIVIGGAAGAFPPLVGWAAVTGDLSPLAWCLFGIIFLWTPVHFWALAILLKQDYARAGVPMLPVVRGDRATVLQIAQYAVLTAVFSILPVLMQAQDGSAAVGWFYGGSAVLLNAVLLLRSAQLYRHPDHPHARSLFRYSMVYLALLFLAMAVDRTGWI